jgi:hypothetical protein
MSAMRERVVEKAELSRETKVAIGFVPDFGRHNLAR